jgi:hypothetical protein
MFHYFYNKLTCHFLIQELNQFLADKIPGYDQVIEPGEFERKGSFNTTTAGFRYMIHLGYRF